MQPPSSIADQAHQMLHFERIFFSYQLKKTGFLFRADKLSPTSSPGCDH